MNIDVLIIMFLPIVFLTLIIILSISTKLDLLPRKVNEVKYINLDVIMIQTTHDSLLNQLELLNQEIVIAQNIKQQRQITIDTLQAQIRLLDS